MIFYVLAVILLILWLDRIRKLRTENIILESEFNFYSLRDKLRELAISGKVDPDNWVFMYLDSSISKTVSVLEYLTWPRFLFVHHRKEDGEVEFAIKELRKELRRPQNHALLEIHKGYGNAMGYYLLRRHFSMSLIKQVVANIYAFGQVGKFLQRKWSEFLRAQTVSPSTSTLQQYAPHKDSFVTHA